MKKLLVGIVVLGLALIAVFALGPRPSFPALEASEADWFEPRGEHSAAAEFAEALSAREAELLQAGALRQNTQARVVFADSAVRAPLVFLYVHGFSASADEGSELLGALARRYGANQYLLRLSDHGLTSGESFAEAHPERWRAEVATAYRYAQAYLGERVVVVGTSTGATLALDLAARLARGQGTNGLPPPEALVLYSPNVALANPASPMLNGPWGIALMRYLSDGDYRYVTDAPEECAYVWTPQYRIEGVAALQELIERTMTPETFAAIDVPVLSAFYYADEEHQDPIISVAAAREMFAALGTEPARKREAPIASVSNHVISSSCRTDGVEDVVTASESFLEEVVGLVPNRAPTGEVD